MKVFDRKSSRSSKIILNVMTEGVDKKFGSDWGFLIAACKMTSVPSLVLLFSILVFVTKLKDYIDLGRIAFLLLCLAAFFYLIVVILIKARAPSFLRQYPDFKTYEDIKHSHRWIVWQFYFNIESLRNGARLLQESVDKLLSLKEAEVTEAECNIKPSYSGAHIERTLSVVSEGQADTLRFKAYKPVNFDRDIVMAFAISDSAGVERRYMLPLREEDAKLDNKIRELFWIIFTESAKENPISRRFSWGFLTLTTVITLLAIIVTVGNAIFYPTDNMLSPSKFQYINSTRLI